MVGAMYSQFWGIHETHEIDIECHPKCQIVIQENEKGVCHTPRGRNELISQSNHVEWISRELIRHTDKK